MREFAIFANIASIAAGSWCLSIGFAESNTAVVASGVVAIGIGIAGLAVPR